MLYPKTYCTLRRQAFNMVEIALALAVIGIALLAVTALIPIGARATAEATGQNYAAMASEQMLQWLANNAANNWATVAGIPDDPPDIKNLAEDWSLISGSTSMYSHDTEDGVYRVVQRTDAAGVDVVDADVIIRLWKEPVSGYTYEGGSAQEYRDTAYLNGARVNIEASWPKDLPYKVRDKGYYVIEVSKQ